MHERRRTILNLDPCGPLSPIPMEQECLSAHCEEWQCWTGPLNGLLFVQRLKPSTRMLLIAPMLVKQEQPIGFRPLNDMGPRNVRGASSSLPSFAHDRHEDLGGNAYVFLDVYRSAVKLIAVGSISIRDPPPPPKGRICEYVALNTLDMYCQ